MISNIERVMGRLVRQSVRYFLFLHTELPANLRDKNVGRSAASARKCFAACQKSNAESFRVVRGGGG